MLEQVGWCAQEGFEGSVEAPADVEESQGERVRRSLVMLDVHLPSIALPDGVHCRAFVGIPLLQSHARVQRPAPYHPGHSSNFLKFPGRGKSTCLPK